MLITYFFVLLQKNIAKDIFVKKKLFTNLNMQTNEQTPNHIVDVIRHLIKQKGIKKYVLAQKIGCRPERITAFLSGRTIANKYLFKMFAVLNLQIIDIETDTIVWEPADAKAFDLETEEDNDE